MAIDLQAAAIEDRELWREREGDYYAPSIFVTKTGAIGINVCGLVFIKHIREWHDLAAKSQIVTLSRNDNPPKTTR
jgi:hypothetical protein